VIIWLDAHLPPALAPWITAQFGIPAFSVSYLGLLEADDATIFQAARDAEAVVMTKDADFLEMQMRFGTPPQIILVTLGNTTNKNMREVLQKQMPTILEFLDKGEPIVEITKESP
jgi:predicted nuclease of predicted toxin-antitoxin system